MKKFEIAALGLEEINMQEVQSIDGGCPALGPILAEIAKMIASGIVGGVLGYYITKFLDAQQDVTVEDVETYFGGELEAAICYG